MLRISGHRLQALLTLTLAFAVFGAYFISLGNDFVMLDDSSLITTNPFVTNFSLSSVAKAFTTYDPELYIPLTFLSYQAEYLFFGARPFVYHLDNLLLHIGTTLLVFRFAELLLKNHPRRTLIAFFTALLFGIHPLNVEAVSWVSARKDLLAGFFSLACLVSYLSSRSRGRISRMSPVFFLLALLSKASAITLPFALLLIDWREEGNIAWKRIEEKWPYAGLMLLFAVIGIIGKTANIAAISLGDRLLLSVKSTVFLLERIFFPANLSILYQYAKLIALSSPDFWIPLLVLLLLAILAFLFRRKRDALFSGAFFLVLLVPSFVAFSRKGDVYLTSDRYVYLSIIGILLLAVETLFSVRSRTYVKVSAATLGGVAALFLFLTAKQSMVWHDTEALYRHNTIVQPESPVPHNELGAIYLNRGDVDDAIREFTLAAALDPSFAIAEANLGAAYGRKGMYLEGLDHLIRAKELKGENASEIRRVRNSLKDTGSGRTLP